MTDINIILSAKELSDLVKETMGNAVKKSLALNIEHIEHQINQYFKKGIFDGRVSQFEQALDWAVENTFREGLEQAMIELNFKELVAQKAKEFLSNENFIRDLAEQKVRASLGLT